MNIKRLVLFGGLALAAFIVFTQIRNLGSQSQVVEKIVEAPAEPVKYVDVLVAAVDAQVGERISPTSLSWKEWPVEAVTSKLITRQDKPEIMAELSGYVVRGEIYEGEPISLRKLIDSEGKGVMASLLNPGMRGVTIQISVDTAAGGFIAPGDRVDIVLTYEKSRPRVTGGTETLNMSETILENVRVLAIDDKFIGNSQTETFFEGSTATLELSLPDIEILKEAEAEGDLILVLRGLGELYNNKLQSKDVVAEFNTITVYRQGQPQYIALTGN